MDDSILFIVNKMLKEIPQEKMEFGQYLKCLSCIKKECDKCEDYKKILNLINIADKRLEILEKTFEFIINSNILTNEVIDKNISFYKFLMDGLIDSFLQDESICHFCRMTNHSNSVMFHDNCPINVRVDKLQNNSTIKSFIDLIDKRIYEYESNRKLKNNFSIN